MDRTRFQVTLIGALLLLLMVLVAIGLVGYLVVQDNSDKLYKDQVRSCHRNNDFRDESNVMRGVLREFLRSAGEARDAAARIERKVDPEQAGIDAATAANYQTLRSMVVDVPIIDCEKVISHP